MKELFTPRLHLRYITEAVDKNIGSNRVTEKAGFELVGIRTESFEQKNAVFTISSYKLYKSK